MFFDLCNVFARVCSKEFCRSKAYLRGFPPQVPDPGMFPGPVPADTSSPGRPNSRKTRKIKTARFGNIFPEAWQMMSAKEKRQATHCWECLTVLADKARADWSER